MTYVYQKHGHGYELWTPTPETFVQTFDTHFLSGPTVYYSLNVLSASVGLAESKPGFVRALEILENLGKFLKPWKSLETPGKAL